MAVVELLFKSQEIGKTEKRGAFHIVELRAETGGGRGRHRPAVFEFARGVGKHKAVVVAAVAECVVGAQLFTERRGADVVVGGAADVAESKRGGAEIQVALRAVEDAGKAAPLGVGGSAQHQVLHLQTIDGDGLVARFQSAVLEVGDVERHGRIVGKHIIGRPHHAGVVAAQVGILVVKSLCIKQEIVHILIVGFGAVGRNNDRLSENGGDSEKQYQ